MTSDIETSINGQPGVVTTVATVGQGSMRFILTYSGQRQYSNYAQIMVRMDDQRSIAALTQHVDLYCAQLPAGERQHKRVMFGPSGDSAIEVRIKGPDPDRLRLLASQVAIFSPQTRPPTACATTGRTAARLSARSIPRAWARAGRG
jgi:multidrug efflux pump subunit AcrB